MRCLTASLAVLAAFCATQSVADSGSPPAPVAKEDAAPAAATEGAPTRMCFGGYEDGKVIVTKDQIQDAALETTAQACRIDGGADARAPQSPVLATRRYAFLV